MIRMKTLNWFPRWAHWLKGDCEKCVFQVCSTASVWALEKGGAISVL